jgi:hypothetical protein
MSLQHGGVGTQVFRGHSGTVLDGPNTVADVKAHVPQERDEEMDEGMNRWADRGWMKEHEIDVRRRVQFPTAIPSQRQQGTGGVDVKCLPTDRCTPAIELTDHDVR